eukprot:CAMPEP_0204382268 /NCGR_PEP_ID=MMETSP0469-20131031/54968_1 /ASSEMBLY_ACC=CAM_ASM_000384 /TAXON_ID=2969 /ORGANISM="Oxyrrhis marina" /LENGTH=30 /DNA_ID= /DNA_START= /DNA_END= /DNA_ORIENTATION=
MGRGSTGWPPKGKPTQGSVACRQYEHTARM